MVEMDFEAQREANIARNRQLLEALELDRNVIEVPKPKPKAKQTKKRKEVHSADEGGDDEEVKRPRKVAVVTNPDGDAANGGPRRSGRNAGRKVDYSDSATLVRPSVPLVSKAARDASEREHNTPMQRTHDPKTFGSIPGVEVGSWWATRQECSQAAIHAPWVAGIAGGPHGCYSVALSGGYEDDVDLGDAFTYTGSGGRDLKGTKQNPKNLRTAPQSFDQTFENRDNQALLKSVESKKPVRVIRGYKLHSKYAPLEGYRYDGLYTVEKAWREKGLNPKGLLVCKFIFKRVKGQPPLPVYADDDEEAASDSNTEPEAVSASEPETRGTSEA